MENLIVCCLLYIVVITIVYSPRHTAAIDYFPEETAIAETQTQTITEPLPVATFKPKPNPVKTPAMATETDLMTQPIRRLKTLAQGRVKGYSNLTKAQLSQRLAGKVPLSEL